MFWTTHEIAYLLNMENQGLTRRKMARKLGRSVDSVTTKIYEATVCIPDRTSAIVLRLKRKRIELGLSQTKLARIVGVGQPRLSEWEAGKRSPTLLDKWSDALGE